MGQKEITTNPPYDEEMKCRPPYDKEKDETHNHWGSNADRSSKKNNNEEEKHVPPYSKRMDDGPPHLKLRTVMDWMEDSRLDVNGMSFPPYWMTGKEDDAHLEDHLEDPDDVGCE